MTLASPHAAAGDERHGSTGQTQTWHHVDHSINMESRTVPPQTLLLTWLPSHILLLRRQLPIPHRVYMMIMEFWVRLQSWKIVFSTSLWYNGETYHVVTPTGHLPTTGGHLTIRVMGFSGVLSTASFSHSCRGQGIGYYQAGQVHPLCLWPPRRCPQST